MISNNSLTEDSTVTNNAADTYSAEIHAMIALHAEKLGGGGNQPVAGVERIVGHGAYIITLDRSVQPCY